MKRKVTDKIDITRKEAGCRRGGKPRKSSGRIHKGSVKKKPPVFIGLGAVFQQDFGTLFFWEPESPGFSKGWTSGIKFR
jgi:hypothetical protein